ncbi:MAG: hypothetical protein MUO85_08965 [candidate division Zixibacteria bacterium]|nr:hypothetical protein [candidate division Zixibacteria bacterium]
MPKQEMLKRVQHDKKEKNAETSLSWRQARVQYDKKEEMLKQVQHDKVVR